MLSLGETDGPNKRLSGAAGGAAGTVDLDERKLMIWKLRHCMKGETLVIL